MCTVVAVGATPARVSRSDMGMPVKRTSCLTKGSKMVAVLVAMASSVGWSNASDLPTLWLLTAPSMRRTVLPLGLGTGAGWAVATGVVMAVVPAEFFGVLEPHPARATTSTATPTTAAAVRLKALPLPCSDGAA
jgi:hypothetical protein